MSAVLHSIGDIASILAQRAEDVAAHLFPNGVKEGSEFCVGSIEGEAGRSLKIHLSGSKAGVWQDFSNPNDKGDLVELWTRSRGTSKGDALREIREWLGINGSSRPIERPKAAAPTPVKDVELDKPINREYHRNLIARLRKSDAAMAYLAGEKRGLDQATVDYFALGLSMPYERKDGTTTVDAVVAPMRSLATGGFLNKSAYITIPDVTQNPIDANGWMKGSPQSYWSAKSERTHRTLFVCEGLKDVWRHWQALHTAGLDSEIMLLSSTHGTGIPADWKAPEFWASWDHIYLGHDNDAAGDEIAERLLEYIGKEARRISVPKELGKDWTDFWQHGGTIEAFRTLLDEAPVASAIKATDIQPASEANVPRIGRFSHKPVDINGAYVNGHLYYPTETHVIKKDDESGQMVERLETIVIRSDRTIHRAGYAPAPPGTPLDRRVLRLTDGTVIEKMPAASALRSWEYESIRDYLDGAKPRPLAALVADAKRFLKKAVWLPYDEDYAALALTVPVTYLQSVFESVPLLLLNGPAGSAKSQTGNTMARLCANGKVIGQISAASAARLIDETRGFVVLDDVEAIAAKAGKDVQVNELVQALKVSYNKHTAVKYWTDVKTMKTERLDFFGVKMLNNTLGADAILGSRMIRIQTRKMPEGMKSEVAEFTPEDLRALRALRNEFHIWAFENVNTVEKAYREVYANKTDRHTEIAAPLRTMAKLIGDSSLSADLETCLARQHVQQNLFDDDPVQTLKEAVKNLIQQGYDTVTLTHLRLEMHALLDANYGMSSTTEIAEWDNPKWIGRQLRSNDMVDPVDLGRKRVYGKNLRLVRFSDWMVEKITHDENGEAIYKTGKDPEAFCQGCAGCAYRNAGCELQELRMREESRAAARKPH